MIEKVKLDLPSPTPLTNSDNISNYIDLLTKTASLTIPHLSIYQSIFLNVYNYLPMIIYQDICNYLEPSTGENTAEETKSSCACNLRDWVANIKRILIINIIIIIIIIIKIIQRKRRICLEY